MTPKASNTQVTSYFKNKVERTMCSCVCADMKSLLLFLITFGTILFYLFMIEEHLLAVDDLTNISFSLIKQKLSNRATSEGFISITSLKLSLQMKLMKIEQWMFAEGKTQRESLRKSTGFREMWFRQSHIPHVTIQELCLRQQF